MKQTTNYIILLIAFVFATYSVKAENVKIYLKFDTKKISQPKVVLLDNGKEYRADSKGIVKIMNLTAGKNYSIKIKYYKNNQQTTKIRVPKIRPQRCTNSGGNTNIERSPSGGCFTVYKISL